MLLVQSRSAGHREKLSIVVIFWNAIGFSRPGQHLPVHAHAPARQVGTIVRGALPGAA
jgi:hypothetical protein